MIRLLIVDDHVLMRRGLKQLLDDEQDIVVKAEAESGDEVLEILKKETVDLVVLDIGLPYSGDDELIEKIRELPNSPPILVLSMHNESHIVKSKLKAGASGYITKNCSPEELLAAIRKVALGGRFIAPDIAEKIAFELSTVAMQAPHDLLSGRELLVLRMLAKGKKVNEIAEELDISRKTVSTHKARLMQKMHIDSDIKLMQYAITYGMTA